MTKPTTALLTALLLTCLAGTAGAGGKLDRRINTATEVLQQISAIPEQGIPPSLLANAYGVAVIPNVIKAGFMVGGSYGKGVLVVRRPDGRWSNPSFITLGAGSFGFQIGAQSSDIVLVFKTRRSVDDIARGKLTLGGDAAVAAGPVGRYTKASTDLMLKAEIYSYSRTRGFFGGISLEGAWIGMDKKSNYVYYETGQGGAVNILADEHIPTPANARRFIEVLAAVAPKFKWNEAPGSRTAAAPAAASEPPATKTKTFAIDDAPPATDDLLY